MSAPVPGDVVADRYAVRRVLGRGGMGLVVEARHLVTGKRVALKWLLPGDGSGAAGIYRMIREARACARVDHPNVVDVYDISEHNGRPFLVMEYLEGVTLSAVLDGDPIEHGRLLAMLDPVLDALAALHQRGVVHRDLKPANLFLCTDPHGRPRHAKLLDFGVSKVQQLAGGELAAGESAASILGASEEHSLTDTGTVLGTPHYMAPEQLDEARSVDRRADIYAVGVILYRALAGVLPFEADSYSTLVLRIASGVPRPLDTLRPDLPDGLSDTIARAMAPRPDDRFADVAQLWSALRPFAASVAYGPEDEGWHTALRGGERQAWHVRPKARRRWAAIVALAVLAAMTLTGVRASQRSRQGEQEQGSQQMPQHAEAGKPAGFHPGLSDGPRVTIGDGPRQQASPAAAPPSSDSRVRQAPRPSRPSPPEPAPPPRASRPARSVEVPHARPASAPPASERPERTPPDPLELSTDQF